MIISNCGFSYEVTYAFIQQRQWMKFLKFNTSRNNEKDIVLFLNTSSKNILLITQMNV